MNDPIEHNGMIGETFLGDDNAFASCSCGWSSEHLPDQLAAMAAWEDHAREQKEHHE